MRGYDNIWQGYEWGYERRTMLITSSRKKWWWWCAWQQGNSFCRFYTLLKKGARLCKDQSPIGWGVVVFLTQVVWSTNCSGGSNPPWSALILLTPNDRVMSLCICVSDVEIIIFRFQVVLTRDKHRKEFSTKLTGFARECLGSRPCSQARKLRILLL